MKLNLLCRVSFVLVVFAVLLVGTGGDEAQVTVERLLRAISNTTFATENATLHITASAGVAEYLSPEDPDRTFARADEALYRAKTSGRDRVEAS